MSQLDPNRRFQIALDRSRAAWAAVDPARAAARAGCSLSAGSATDAAATNAEVAKGSAADITLAGGVFADTVTDEAAASGNNASGANANQPVARRAVIVPFFGGPHSVSHPEGETVFIPTGRQAHVSVAIVLMHYLLTADGTPPADSWSAFRDLPDGLFYAQAFAAHAETPLATRFGNDLAAFDRAAEALRGFRLDLADRSYRFQALPRLAVAVLLWEGDDEFARRASILFDAQAGHYLPTEDLSGIGDWLSHRLLKT